MKCQRILLAPLFPQLESKALGRKALHLASALEATLEKLAPGEQPLYAEILRQVRQRRPDLLVLESAVDLLAKRPWSQAERHLLDKCPCPVMLIRSSRSYFNPTVIAAVEPECAQGKSVELDDEILDAAGVLSSGLRARLVIFQAARSSWDIVRGVSDDTAACLRAASANIVVMGFAQRPWLERILNGHTSERTAAASTSDLLIVKPLLNQTMQPLEPTRASAAAVLNQLRPPAGHAAP